MYNSHTPDQPAHRASTHPVEPPALTSFEAQALRARSLAERDGCLPNEIESRVKQAVLDIQAPPLKLKLKTTTKNKI